MTLYDFNMQIPGCSALRTAHCRLEFPDSAKCPPTNPPPKEITVTVETGATAFDVMVAASDTDRSYNFTASYFGNIGFYIDAINGTANTETCFWYYFYQTRPPALPIESSSAGLAVGVTTNGFIVIFRYKSIIKD